MRWFAFALTALLATPVQAQIFDSMADTVFDLIEAGDPSVFACLEQAGTGPRQIWDRRIEDEPVVEAFLFNALFQDGTRIEIAVNPEFGSTGAARAEAERYTGALGQLPTSLRAGIERFSIHRGSSPYHAGTGQIVAYSDRTDQRVAVNGLEETLFHEAVHASWDDTHRLHPAWRTAQLQDGAFLTGYGASRPDREDLADTAPFVFALLHHPGRVPPADAADIRETIPNRIDYIAELLPPGGP
ncbi:MAG: hypothetical protein AAF376_12980, partial [Pseudomonadota bacterium]